MILVTAANGNQGRKLIPRLVAAGVPVRASVRSDASALTVRAAGVSDVVAGDLNNPEVLARAMVGVDKVYYVGPALDPDERAMGFAAIEAARAAGVAHFVFSSVLHAILTDLVQHEIKRDLEECLISSGMEFTVLQPANYMLRHRLLPAFEDGIFPLAWALDRYQSMVDLGDVTEVAAAVLADSRLHTGATYELVAPGRHTAHDLAEIISRVASREVVAKKIDPDDFLLKAFGADSPTQYPYQARLLRAISDRYSSHDFVGNPNVLTWLLGHEPATFEQFVRNEFDAHK